ncbi:MAG: FapA family protein [bacterium]
MNETTQVIINIADVAAHLREGLEKTIDRLERHPGGLSAANELRASLPLLDQFPAWFSTLSPGRFRSILFSLLKSIDDILTKAVRAGAITPEVYGATAACPSAPFLADAILSIGPEVHVSQDQMAVRAVIDEGFESYWNPDLIKSGLTRLGFQGEWIEKNIALMLRHPGRPFRVLAGKAPVPGVDAVIQDCLNLPPPAGVPIIQKDGRADFKELDRIRAVSEGQVVLQKIPAVPGVPGLNVYGQPIACRDGQDYPLPAVPNTALTPDGLALVSTLEGCAYRDGPRIVVAPLLQIKGDVNYATGNIQSAVSVHVCGDVLSGFRVESEQDILVSGTVEGSKIHARGDIYLPGGVQGKSEAVIQADHHVEVKFINAAWVHAGKSILVHGSVIQSFLRAPRISLLGRDADLIGGLAEAADDLCADRIGSDIGVRTRVHLGYDIVEAAKKTASLQASLQSLQERKDKAAGRIATLAALAEKTGSLSPAQAGVQAKLQSHLAKLDQLMAAKQQQLQLAEEELHQANARVRTVRARKQIFPGAEIMILEHTFAPTEPTGPATLVVSGEGIAVLPYQERIFEDEEEVHE